MGGGEQHAREAHVCQCDECIHACLRELSPQARDLARVAALCATEFAVHGLVATGEWTEDEAAPALIELMACGLVTACPTDGLYSLVSEPLRQHLLEMVPPPRKAMLHRRIAETLEQVYGEGADYHAADLADHFSGATVLWPSLAPRAVHYSHVAGERYAQARDWTRAARRFELGADLATEYGSSCPHLDIVALRVAAAEAWKREGAWRSAWRQIMQAVQLCSARDDRQRLAETTLVALEGMDPPPALRATLARNAIDSLNGAERPYAARLYAQLASVDLGDEPEQAAEQARRAAREHPGARELVEEALEERELVLAIGRGELLQAQRMADQRLARGLERNDSRITAGALVRLAEVAVGSGELERAGSAAACALDYTRKERLPVLRNRALYVASAVHLARCQLDVFDELWGNDSDARMPRLLQARRLELEGRYEDALSALPTWNTPGADHPRAAWDIHGSMARLLSRLGRTEEARSELSAWSSLREVCRHPLDRHSAVAFADHALTRLAPRDIVVEVAAEVGSWREIRFLYWSAVNIDRMRGDLALRVGSLSDADRHYAVARRWAAAQGAPLEQALALQGQAAVAGARGDGKGAASFGQRAEAILDSTGLPPTLLAQIAQVGHDVCPAVDGISGAPLTEREIEVLQLVSTGMTNREIAIRLNISHHTVSRHVSSILSKTGSSNRASAAMLLARMDLV